MELFLKYFIWVLIIAEISAYLIISKKAVSFSKECDFKVSKKDLVFNTIVGKFVRLINNVATSPALKDFQSKNKILILTEKIIRRTLILVGTIDFFKSL